MPFALPQLTGHSGAQHGESAGPLAEGGGERKKGWMDGWREGGGGGQINEVEMRGNSSCATAGLPNSEPAWPRQLARSSSAGPGGAPLQQEAPGPGSTTGPGPGGASEVDQASNFIFQNISCADAGYNHRRHVHTKEQFSC